ncbi:EAL domain-containing protein [Anoxybacillus ayderensis]|uniref:EAL domain-containing protein n=1 Tax=Anoxybacillus ayderensis TaxID=265546 RepID=UPI000A268EC3|nr:EAL domain-containing protein [Anoxybacillus ayderensis]MED0656163.1 EAL domain-containing protein [Anoxybacillus ayderensis]MED0687028.1 EAL domain-containing protein [Anoxybacillus ayderensis]OSX54253.1 diguanylate phosphodiesterase [Anoxybacillus ayderensis]
MYSCISCSVPFPLLPSGYLLIMQEQQKKYLCYSYDSLQQLATYVETIHEKEKMLATLCTNPDVPEPFVPLHELSMRIKHADVVQCITNEPLMSYLQPIIHTNTGDVFAYECLLRSQRFSPGQLFSVAQQTGLHTFLDRRAREEAIRSRTKIKKGIKSFINFLPSTIYNPEFCLRHTFSIVEQYNVAPEDLVFEVVETEKIVDIDHLKNVFATYKRSGMKVALDDVGAGFSTIDMLTLLQPDYVKIDRHYIQNCDKEEEKQAFLKEVTRIANTLGIHVLAEGIERKEELDYCREIGIPFAQGYYIGKPSPDPL